MDVERFERDRKIDPAELDLAAATQADCFFYWAEQSVRSRSAMEKAKLEMELVESRLSIRCRSKPEEFGLERITENGLSAVVQSHRKFLAAREAWLAAKEESMLLDVVVAAMEQRKRMIEVLITLHGQQYFAGPKVPRDLVSSWQAYEKSGSRVIDAQVARIRKRSQREEERDRR